MAQRNVLPPKELTDRVRGPGFVWLDFGDDEPLKYECLVLGSPGSALEECHSVWLTEEVGKPGETDYRLKHFPPGEYTAIFEEFDDVTGRPIFGRAYGFDGQGKNLTKNPAGFGPSGTPSAPAKPKADPKGPKSTGKKPAAKKATKNPAQKPSKPAKAKKKETPKKQAAPKKTGNRRGKKNT
jgi:hypothetical protein